MHLAMVILAYILGVFAIAWLLVPWGLPRDEPQPERPQDRDNWPSWTLKLAWRRFTAETAGKRRVPAFFRSSVEAGLFMLNRVENYHR